DVLPDHQGVTLGVEQPGGVQATGGVEDLLRGTQPVRQGGDRLGRPARRVLGRIVAGGGDHGVEGRLAADTARGGGVLPPSGHVERGDIRPAGGDVEQVVGVAVVGVHAGAVADRVDLVAPVDDAFGEQEP